MSEMKRFYRSRSERMVAGICGGLGKFLGIDPTLIRLVAVLVALTWPFALVVYFITMLIVPEEPQEVIAEPVSPEEA